MQFEDGQWTTGNQFYEEGRRVLAEKQESHEEWLAEREAAVEFAEEDEDEEVELLKGKLKREELKQELFEWLNQ